MLKTTLIIIYALLTAIFVRAQAPSTWNYGVIGHYSFEQYRLNNTSYSFDRPNLEYDIFVKPKFALGSGIWIERGINKLFSISSRLEYHVLRIDDEFLSGWYIKVGGGRPYQEWHHSVSLALLGRLYVPTNLKLKIHLDAGMKADKIIMFRDRYAKFDFRQWDPKFFNAVVPAWLGAVGVQYGRLGLSVEYQNFIWNDALTRKMDDSERRYSFHRDVYRKNLTLNATFRLNPTR